MMKKQLLACALFVLFIASVAGAGSMNSLLKVTVQAKDSIDPQQEDDFIECPVDPMPQYPGGESALMDFMYDNLEYPKESNADGKVYVCFLVTADGTVKDAEIKRSLDIYCDKEVLRVVGKMPRWIPAKLNGVNISSYYIIPITFKNNRPKDGKKNKTGNLIKQP